ncbi:hypothetical protein NRB20_06320 [Nocardia sp. RB20]|uniref:Uncharacterized protein n=1 Tax=Nocardia macrotermitis TaxID=2585198 RepID=A0A7K0CVV6_9NOCA|nr:hypothetical protein [Nocardia macrotermitis]
MCGLIRFASTVPAARPGTLFPLDAPAETPDTLQGHRRHSPMLTGMFPSTESVDPYLASRWVSRMRAGLSEWRSRVRPSHGRLAVDLAGPVRFVGRCGRAVRDDHRRCRGVSSAPHRPCADASESGGVAVAGQLGQCPDDAVLGMWDRPPVDAGSGVIDDAHVVGSVSPVPADEQRWSPSRSGSHLAGEGRCRKLTDRPSIGRVPDAGPRASAGRGWRYSSWPSNGSRTRPCTHRDREVTTLPVRLRKGWCPSERAW